MLGARGAPHDPDADSLEGRCEAAAELSVAIADEDLRSTIHRGVAGLLRAPRVGRSIRHGGVNHRATTEVEEEEHEDLAEPYVIGLDEVAQTAWLRRKVAQRWPSLGCLAAVMYFWTVRLLTRYPELEELTANALGSPSWILRGHLSDESGAGRGATPESARAATPERAKPLAMPAKYGGRLHEHSHGAPRRREACRESHRVSLEENRPKARSPHDLPLGDDQLLAQKGVLRDELRARRRKSATKSRANQRKSSMALRTPIGSGPHL